MLTENIFLLIGLSILVAVVAGAWSAVLLTRPAYWSQTGTVRWMILLLIILVDGCLLVGIGSLYVYGSMLGASIFFPIAIIPATMAHAALDGGIMGQAQKEFRSSLAKAMGVNRWIMIGMLIVFTGEVGYPDDNMMFAYLISSLMYALSMHYLCLLLMTWANTSYRKQSV